MSCKMLTRVNVNPVFDACDSDYGCASTNSRQIRSTRHEIMLAHPDDMRGELVGDYWPRHQADKKIAAGHVDIVGQSDCDRVASSRDVTWSLQGQQLFDAGTFA